MADRTDKDAKRGAADGVPAKGRGKKGLVLLALPVLLAGLAGGLWFSGLLSGLFGGGEPVEAAAAPVQAAAPVAPSFVDLPEIVSNLNAPGRRASFVRLKAKLEVARPEDAAAVTAAMPRLLDLFSTYLREVRPEELRGSAGSHRLRQELIARATIAAAPARVTDVLFMEILVQ